MEICSKCGSERVTLQRKNEGVDLRCKDCHTKTVLVFVQQWVLEQKDKKADFMPRIDEIVQTIPEHQNIPKDRVDEAGKPCRRCQKPVVLVQRSQESIERNIRKGIKKGKAFFYSSWLYCAPCKMLYFQDKYKVFKSVMPTTQENQTLF